MKRVDVNKLVEMLAEFRKEVELVYDDVDDRLEEAWSCDRDIEWTSELEESHYFLSQLIHSIENVEEDAVNFVGEHR